MAEAIARYDAADVIEAFSVGLSPLGAIAEQTKQTLTLNGYSADELTSAALTREAADAADIIINMTGAPIEGTFWDREKVEDWMVQDPYGAGPETYQRVFEGIKRRVDQLAKGLREKREEDQMPISARLAEELKVTPPAVTAALKRMTRDGHVRVQRSGRIDLTQKGRRRAEHLALRHQLAEMLLTEVIGLSWAKAHDEAERMEHAISPEVEALLLKRFGDKKSCPHGVPMRGGIAQLRKQGAVLLADLRAKEAGEILCVYEKDAQFLEFLEGLRFRPSTTVKVLKREYDETMTLRSNGKTMHLGKPATSRIWVRRLSA